MHFAGNKDRPCGDSRNFGKLRAGSRLSGRATPAAPSALISRSPRQHLRGRRLQLLPRIQIAKHAGRKPRLRQFLFFDHLHHHGIEQRVNLVPSLAQRLLYSHTELPPINAAQRLPASTSPRHSRYGPRASRPRNQISQQGRRHKRHIHRQHQIQLRRRSLQRRMDSPQRPAPAKYIFHYRSERRKLVGISYNSYIVGNRAGYLQSPRQQRAAVEFHKGFVRTHARTFAARENKSRQRIPQESSLAAIIHQ